MLWLALALHAVLVPEPANSEFHSWTTIVQETSPVESSPAGGVPPPLPGSCVTGGTPIDYSNAVCCVSGYVYHRGAPIANADVAISAHGRTIHAGTRSGPGSTSPYFSASLDTLPLEVRPGDLVTLTVSVDDVSKIQTFVAQAGGQQVDIVLPQSNVEARWLRGELPWRTGYDLTYDVQRERAVVFGGVRGRTERLNDTWEWDGASWTVKPPTQGPEPREGHALAYDGVRERVVLFGGRAGSTPFNDTWEWDGSAWNRQVVTVSPPARFGHAMVYDAGHDRILLFGGWSTVDGNRLGDTWEWDGRTWTERIPPTSPTARGNHALAYDAGRGRVVLFGGNPDDFPRSDTWEWDGNTWRQMFPPTWPSPREFHTMTYDASRQRVVLAGGENQEHQRDIWEWNGQTWIKSSSPATPAMELPTRLIYDSARETLVLFDSAFQVWERSQSDWQLIAPAPDDIGLRTNMGLSYEDGGRFLLFGGDHVGPDNRTYRWQESGWFQLTPTTTPMGRYGHRLVRNQASTQLLMFGGVGASDTYLNDTWLWNGNNWEQLFPPVSPSPRAFYSLTFDSKRSVWILFGGQNPDEYLDDTWEFDGQSWRLRTPSVRPQARAKATLTFDVKRGHSVLVGGKSLESYLDDVWEWDGTQWIQIFPDQRLPQLAGHAAAYDSHREVVVIAGGAVPGNGTLSTTWEWNGSFWRQRHAGTSLPARRNFAMDYDPEHDRLLATGGDNCCGRTEGTYLQYVVSTPTESSPIATINRIHSRDARHGIDEITFQGSGADPDSDDIITGYRWWHDNAVISTQQSFTRPASAFPLGEQVVALQVLDDEGVWSATVEQRLFIRDANGGTGSGHTWTLLVYAVADNNLDPYMGDNASLNGMLYRLRTAGAQSYVNLAVLYDGPDVNDTRRYILDETGTWTSTPIGEVRMDDWESLRDFINWGRAAFTSDYYALSLADHANGVVGFGQDLSSDSTGRAFLTPIDLRSALQAATNDGAHQLDVLHFDGCSFGLLEDAAIAAGQAHFVVASPNTGWGTFSYDLYRQRAAEAPDPRSYAHSVAETYAQGVAANELPYTVSVFDMAHFEPLKSAVGALGTALAHYVQASPVARIAELHQLRISLQKYDSGGTRPLELDNDDSYVDLLHLVTSLKSTIQDVEVSTAATAVGELIQGDQGFVSYEQHASGEFLYYDPALGADRAYEVNLNHANGLAIFYPPRATTSTSSAYQAYIQHKIFDITAGWGWTRFLGQSLPSLGSGDPPALPNNQLISPLIPPTESSGRELIELFLPVIGR